ncbi:MAG: PEP-CTERM sorting domain-containing protein [Planctomycetales bacterium]
MMKHCLLSAGLLAVMSTSVWADNIDFNTAVTIGPTQAPDTWYTDRYAPNIFLGNQIAPDGRTGTLQEGIRTEDAQVSQGGTRGGSFTSDFYNTQGRKYDLSSGVTSAFIELYVPTSWDTLNQDVVAAEGRLGSFWATATDNSNAITAFPIIEFNNNRDLSGDDGFRIWDGLGWIDVAGFVGYDQWYDIGIIINGSQFDFYVNGVLVHTDAAIGGSTQLANIILQGYNAGDSYDIFWDDLRPDGAPLMVAPVPEPASLAIWGVGGLGMLIGARRRRKRQRTQAA